MRFLRNIEGKTRSKNKKTAEEKLKINTWKDKLISNRIRWYGHVLKMNKKRKERSLKNMRHRPRSGWK
jgi:hypothetical protein